MFFWLGVAATSLFPQDSRIPQPQPDGEKNWLANSYPASKSDRDQVSVIFFEVPDTLTSPLYFTVYDAGCLADAESFDYTTSRLPQTRFSLWGGSGALSDPRSRRINYARTEADATAAGTLLTDFTADNSATYDSCWYYFPYGVSPSQGEHIGNKYYFKVVVQVLPPASGEPADANQYNAYILDISYSKSTNPVSVPGVRSFAYCWSICVGDDADSDAEWELYPFVPENTLDTDYIVFHNFNFDGVQNTDILTALTNSGKQLTTPAASDNAAIASTSYNIYEAEHLPPLSRERDGTWTLRITETNDGFDNMCAFWFTRDKENNFPLGDGEPLRIYSHAIRVPAAPALDHVVLACQDGIAVADNLDTETVSVQITEATGNPAPYSRNIYLRVIDTQGNPARIAECSAGRVAPSGTEALITTDEYGTGWIKVRRNADTTPLDRFTVQVEARWDGTGNLNTVGLSSSFGTAGTTTLPVIFYENPDPRLSSAANQTFECGAGATRLATITITHPSNPAKLINAGTGELRLHIPAALACRFAAVLPTLSGTAVANVQATGFSADGKTLILDITNTLASGATLLLDNLQLEAFSAVGSGQLELSWDAGNTYPVKDDKVYTIDTPGLNIWTGSSSGDWNIASNWSSGLIPGSGDRVLIPAGPTRQPVLTAAAQVGELTVASGASLTLGANPLTIAGAFNAAGTLNATGGGQITVRGNVDFTSGTYLAGTGSLIFSGGRAQNFITTNQVFGPVVLTTAATAVTLQGAATLTNLTINANTAFYLQADMSACTLQIRNGGNLVNNGIFGIMDAAYPVTLQAASGTFNFTGANDILYRGQGLRVGGINYQLDTSLPANTILTLLADCRYNRILLNGAGAGLLLGNHTLTVGGNLSITNGTVTLGIGSQLLATGWDISLGTNGNLRATGNITCRALNAQAGSTIDNTGTNTITANGDVSIRGTFTNPANSTIRMNGDSTLMTATVPIGNLIIAPAGNGLVSIAANDLTVSGSLQITSGATLATAAYNLTVNGLTDLDGLLDFSASGSHLLQLNGNLDCDGTLQATGDGQINLTGEAAFTNGYYRTGSGVFTFMGRGVQRLTAAGNTFGNLRTSNANTELDLRDNLTCASLTIDTGTNFALASYTLLINGELNNNGTLWRYANSFCNKTDIDSGLVTYNGAGGNIQDYGDLDYYSLSINGPTGTFTLAAGLATARNLIVENGVLDIAGYRVTVGGNFNNWARVLRRGTPGESIPVDADTGTVIYQGLAGGTIQEYGAADYYNLIINGGSADTPFTNLANLQVNGSLTINASTYLSTENYNVDVTGAFELENGSFLFRTSTGSVPTDPDSGTVIYRGAGGPIQDYGNIDYFNLELRGPGTFSMRSALTIAGNLVLTSGTLDVTAAAFPISVMANWQNTGARFISGTGTVELAGEAPGQILSQGQPFYNLVINKNALAETIALGDDLQIEHDITLQRGTLAAGNHDIFLTGNGGTWNNAAQGVNTNFNSGSATVNVENNFSFLGDNIFNNFSCRVPLVTLAFQPLRMQTINGTLTIHGAADNFIMLTSTNDNVPAANPAAPPQYNNQWLITVNNLVDINYARVRLSYAINVIIPENSESYLFPTGDAYNNNQWYFTIPIESSVTRDLNGNGRIDALEVLVKAGTRFNDDFSGLEIHVDDYGNYATPGCFSTGSTPADRNDNRFYIYLNESNHLDTDATPHWQIRRNATLFANNGGAYANTDTSQRPADGANPVIGYTLAVADTGNPTRVYIYFSEPVSKAPGGTALTATDFIENAASQVTAVAGINPAQGPWYHEAYMMLDAQLTSEEIISTNPLTTLQASLNAIVDQSGNPMPTIPHRISDFGLNIIDLVYAKDLVTTQDRPGQGVGYISQFDGSGWLRDQDLLLGAVSSKLSCNAQTTLCYDNTPGTPPVFNNLWLPNLVSQDLAHKQNTAAHTTNSISTNPWTFSLAATDSKIFNGADLDVVLIIPDGGTGLPCVRVTDPNDPRTAVPWKFKIRELHPQENNITVLNNVINPDKGESVKLHYLLPSAGQVSVRVFDLKGDIVDTLYSGYKQAGEHSSIWYGKNRGGRAVARGIYFIRLTGPGIEADRKVLVVR